MATPVIRSGSAPGLKKYYKRKAAAAKRRRKKASKRKTKKGRKKVAKKRPRRRKKKTTKRKFTRTAKLGHAKKRYRCPTGSTLVVSSASKKSRTGKTWTAIRGRCIRT